MPEIKPAVLEAVVSMIVHDLRNPTATIGANLSFVREVLEDESVPREEVADALADAQQALHDLTRGLDQLLWLGRFANDRPVAGVGFEPLRATFERLRERVRYGALELAQPAADLRVRGGEALERLLELLIANAHQHAPRSTVRVTSYVQGARVVIEVVDDARPLAPELAAAAFSLEGQTQLKGKAEGRYSRVLGLFTAANLAATLGATLEAHERERQNVFRVTLASAETP